MSNSIYRVFTENLGGTNVEEFVGNIGEVFYDPEVGDLRVSDGTTAGGLHLTGSGGGLAPWVRTADWLEMPTVANTEQKFVGLFPVYDYGGNYVALYFEGDYTVDWGDGNIEDVSSGVKAQHSYDYAEIPSNTESVRGYRQVLITVTPQSGQDLTWMDLTSNHDFVRSNSKIDWLDLIISLPEASSGGISISITGYYGSNGVYTDKIERISLLNTGGMTDFSYLFAGGYDALRSVSLDVIPAIVTNTASMFTECYNITSFPEFDTASVTNMSNMFSYCYALTTVPLFDTASVTDMSYMFYDCNALTTVPLFDTASVQSMYYMFGNCNALTTVPLFDTASVTNMSNMFNSCYTLTTVPLFDTASVTDMSGMFSNCSTLTTVPEFDTTSVTDMSGMFSYCYALTEVPLFDTTSVTDMSGMFSYCYALTEVPLFDTASVTNMSNMFNSCYTLTTVPLFDTASVTNMSNMFFYCYALTEVPLFDTSSVTDMNSIFYNCPSLEAAKLNGTQVDINYSYCYLSASALNDIFDGLATVGSTKNINITGNPGTATCNTSIATGKNWTVTT